MQIETNSLCVCHNGELMFVDWVICCLFKLVWSVIYAMKLLNGDWLELLTDVDDNSVDLVFCDLPYGQTTCTWDCTIDLIGMRKQFKIIRTYKYTPALFTSSTILCYKLIKSNEPWFRYDVVWETTSPVWVSLG